jgi:uncharacterized membrane protein YfcA
MISLLPFYTLALVVVFLGVVLNIPGSVHINALLLNFYEPHKVLLLTTIFLTLGSLARTIVFWKNIQWKETKWLTIYGVLGGFIGGYSVGIIPSKIIALIFILSGAYYIYRFYNKQEQHHSHKNMFLAGFVTSLLQAFGISVGPLRQGYLFAKGHTLQEVHGTIAITFLLSGSAMVFARLFHEKIALNDILPILFLFPFMLLTMLIAKKILFKIPKHVADKIIIYSLVISLLTALPKVIELLR